MILNCDQLEKRLSDLLDGAEDAALQAEVAEHLATCDACRLTLDEVGAVRRLSRRRGRLHLSDDARDRIRNAIEDAD